MSRTSHTFSEGPSTRSRKDCERDGHPLLKSDMIVFLLAGPAHRQFFTQHSRAKAEPR